MQNKDSVTIVVSLIWLIISYVIILFFNDEVIIYFAAEDGIYETASAICFFLTSVVFFYLYLKDIKGNQIFVIKTKRNLFYLLLGLLFLFGAGEEISWGQRIFNFQTPDELKEINRQNEFNIHNLKIFHGDSVNGESKTGLAAWTSSGRLLNMFWFFFCFVIPILYRKSRNISKVLETINLPIVPMWIGILFLANWFVLRVISFFLTDEMIHYITEIKESNYAFLFFAMGLCFFSHYKNRIKIETL